MKIHQARYMLYMIGINSLAILLLYFLLEGWIFGILSTAISLAILSPWIYVYYLAYLTDPPENTYQDINTETAVKKIEQKQDKIEIVDVRSQREYEARRLPNSTRMNYKQVEENLEKIQSSKEDEILIFCAIGHRSKIASKKLTELGFKNVKNVVGGIEGFRDKGYPLEE